MPLIVNQIQVLISNLKQQIITQLIELLSLKPSDLITIAKLFYFSLRLVDMEWMQ